MSDGYDLTDGLTRDERAAIMACESWPPQRFDPITGRTDEPIEMHHIIRRSDGGTKGPQIPLCKTTHAYAKGSNYILGVRDGDWAFRPLSLRFAHYVSDWRSIATHSLVPIKVGQWYPCIREQDGIDLVDIGAERDIFEAEVARVDPLLTHLEHAEADAWRMQAEGVSDIYNAAMDASATKREGIERFRAWREQRGLSAQAVSKMRTVVTMLAADECREMYRSQQYELAAAIKGRKAERDVLIADAEALSPTDFRARYWPPKDAPELERCPMCGLLVDPERLKEEEA